MGTISLFLVAVTASLALIGAATRPASADFPGSGDRQKWQEANKLCQSGCADFEQNKYESSFMKMQQAIALYPQDPLFFFDLGLAHQRHSTSVPTEKLKYTELIAAEDAYKKGLALKPNSWMLLEHLGRVEWDLKEYDDALKHLDAEVKLKDTPAQNRADTITTIRQIQGEIAIVQKRLKQGRKLPFPLHPRELVNGKAASDHH